MRNLKQFMIFSLIFFINCTNVQKKEINQKISKPTDSLNISTKKGLSNIFKVNAKCDKVSFEDFFKSFGRDSTFQKQHIKYPLKESYIESLENTKIITDTIYDASEYIYINFEEDKNSMNREYDKYTVEVKKINDNLYYYYWIGYDNGIHLTYRFQLIDNCWFLVEILDMSA